MVGSSRAGPDKSNTLLQCVNKYSLLACWVRGRVDQPWERPVLQNVARGMGF